MFDFLSLNVHAYRADMFDKVLKTLHQENTLKSILIISYQSGIEYLKHKVFVCEPFV